MIARPRDPPIVLVPLDGTTHALDALPVARALAAIKHATLHVLHIGARALPPADLLATLGLAEDGVRGSVLEQRAGASGAAVGEEICRAAREWRDVLIVMCTHAGSPSIAGALGRVAACVLREADCPVVLVRPERGMRPWQLKHALIAHDGTPTTSVCIGPAVELAQSAGALLSVLHVAAAGAKDVEEGALSTPRFVDQRQHEWPAWANEFIERVGSACPVDPRMLRLSLVAGEPGEAVVAYARGHEVDLIILAWHGSLDVARARIVKAALRSAPCPLMVMRVDAAAAAAPSPPVAREDR